ncbi:MAG: RNA methyltransferase [Bacteroidales bacterium]|nr:RNA methyltransferase [Bacteroidales bacterium]
MSVDVTYPTRSQLAAFLALDPRKRIELLEPFLTDERLAMLRSKLSRRTKRLTIALENIYHSQNASAVVRTCECMGLQDLTVIENSSRFLANNGVARGASKWLSFHRFNTNAVNTPEAYDFLHANGYKIVAASPHTGHDVSLYDLDVTESPLAVVFGAEKVGLSQWAMDNADVRMAIPMYGMTESLNISASVAIVASHLRRTIDQSLPPSLVALSQDEQDEVLSQWFLASIRDAQSVLDRVLSL